MMLVKVAIPLRRGESCSGVSHLLYLFLVSLSRQLDNSAREVLRGRNGEIKAGCGFFMILRSCVAAFFSSHARRIIPWRTEP
jgi:hypothetical protein